LGRSQVVAPGDKRLRRCVKGALGRWLRTRGCAGAGGDAQYNGEQQR